MRKLLASTLMVVGVVSAVTLATRAFFSDTETSNANTFQAGAIDLQVDAKGEYNGYECDNGQWTCEPWADQVISFNQGARKNGSAVLAERSNPYNAVGPAQDNDTENFVSLGFSLGDEGELVLGFSNKILNGAGDDLEIVETSYNDPSDAAYPESAQVWASKDGVSWELLGSGIQDETYDLGSLDWAKYIKIKDNTNKASFPNDADGYDVDGVRALHCSADPVELEGSTCGSTWELNDLDASYQFFNHSDIKPGDFGENTISLHVTDNDAFACMYINEVENNDVDLTEPETESVLEDQLIGLGNGEIAENVQFFAWMDDGDNKWENGEEPILEGPVAAATWVEGEGVFPLYTPLLNGGAVLPALQTKYVGLAWCAGTMEISTSPYKMITCDGSTMGNEAQTDELKASISLYVEQARNNENFTCQRPEVTPF